MLGAHSPAVPCTAGPASWLTCWGRDVFLPVLLLLLVTQLPSLFVLKMPAWTTFAGWFMRLPLT